MEIFFFIFEISRTRFVEIVASEEPPNQQERMHLVLIFSLVAVKSLERKKCPLRGYANLVVGTIRTPFIVLACRGNPAARVSRIVFCIESSV
jgi:hypothetical protein